MLDVTRKIWHPYMTRCAKNSYMDYYFLNSKIQIYISATEFLFEIPRSTALLSEIFVQFKSLRIEFKF